MWISVSRWRKCKSKFDPLRMYSSLNCSGATAVDKVLGASGADGIVQLQCCWCPNARIVWDLGSKCWTPLIWHWPCHYMRWFRVISIHVQVEIFIEQVCQNRVLEYSSCSVAVFLLSCPSLGSTHFLPILMTHLGTKDLLSSGPEIAGESARSWW